MAAHLVSALGLGSGSGLGLGLATHLVPKAAHHRRRPNLRGALDSLDRLSELIEGREEGRQVVELTVADDHLELIGQDK